MRFGLTGIGVGLLALAAFATACQTYDFEPVEPLAISQTTERVIVKAKAGKPNVMLVVDKSGSMKDPVDPSDPDCGSGTSACGSATGIVCPSSCPTRLVEMKAAMNTFLSQSGSVALFGLTGFPDADPANSSTVCRTGVIVQDIPDVPNDDANLLQNAATQINNTVQAINTSGLPAAGGTPTAATLNLLANHPTLQDPDREDIVLLLTDGLPNCNGQLDPSTCTCVTGVTPCNSPLNCLDSDNSVAAVTALRQKGIRTIVIGFGADTGASLGRSALNAMAVAGGFERTCTTSTDCATGDTCNNGKCGLRFYQAANGAALAQVLAQLTGIIDPTPCEYTFSTSDRPSDPSFIVVYVDGEKQYASGDTWNYSEPSGVPTVTFTGSTCTRLENSTATEPVDVQIQLLQTL